MTARTTEKTFVSRLRGRLGDLVWLTLVWVLLWGSFTPLTLVGGVLVALIVTTLFRLPAPTDRLAVRPWKLLGLAGFLVRDVIVSGAEVSWQTLRYGPRARGAIIEIPLLCSSDREMTILATATALSPGSMVLQIDHEHGAYYVYALGPRDGPGVDRARREALDLQRRVLEAFGSTEEIAAARGSCTDEEVAPR